MISNDNQIYSNSCHALYQVVTKEDIKDLLTHRLLWLRYVFGVSRRPQNIRMMSH